MGKIAQPGGNNASHCVGRCYFDTTYRKFQYLHVIAHGRFGAAIILLGCLSSWGLLPCYARTPHPQKGDDGGSHVLQIDTSDYYTNEKLESLLQDLALNYPHLASMHSLGTSELKNNLWYMR